MRMIKLGRILSLLIVSFIILTSMSECKQGDVPLVEYTNTLLSMQISMVFHLQAVTTHISLGAIPV